VDRLKLETVYLRALDASMSAADEYQTQAAIFRLRGPRLACTGGKCRGHQLPTTQEESLPSRAVG
jgi:hypothetical protein